MMRKDRANWIGNLFLLAMLLVLMSLDVSALGVGPSRQIISFSPGQEIEGELIIINDQAEEFRAAVYSQGDLADYVTIINPLIDVESSDTVGRVQYVLKFPLDAPKPGTNKIDLVVRPFPKGADVDDGAVISANIAVISQMIIKVPYPGSYAEGKLFISGTEDGTSPARFFMTVYNFGTEDIDEVYAHVEVQGPLLGKIADFNTETKSVKSKETVNIEASWTPSVNKGSYKAVVTVYYGEKQFRIEQNFDLGNFVIDISDIEVNKFTLGDVAKFDILLENRWNTVMKDVYAKIIVEDGQGKLMTESKTAAIDIAAKQSGKLEAYWYTEGVAPGIYTVKLIVHYSDRVVQKDYEFIVDTNSMTRQGVMVGQAVSREADEEQSMQGFLIVLILVVIALLLAMNIVWFYFLSKQFRKGGDK